MIFFANYNQTLLVLVTERNTDKQMQRNIYLQYARDHCLHLRSLLRVLSNLRRF